MTRVCHMTSAHLPEDVRIFHKECVSLAKAGYETYLVQRGGPYEKEGVHVVGVGEIPASRRKRMTEGARKVYEAALAIDADLYHFHDPELLPYGLKLKKRGKRVIFDSHEHTAQAIYEKRWIPAPLRPLVYHAFSAEQLRVCRQLDAVVTVTPHIAAYFRACNPNTVEVRNYPIFQELPPPDYSERRLAFAGGVAPNWNHETVLRAMEQIPDCRYTLCGSGAEAYLASLRALPAWERVDYRGRLPHEEVGRELQRCTVGLALGEINRNGDQGNGSMGNTKIFEEMMAGLPVVCTNYALWLEFVNRWQCGICVKPDDPDAVAAAIRRLLDDPGEAKRMGENGRKAVKEEFNWGVEEKKLLALYKTLLRE